MATNLTEQDEDPGVGRKMDGELLAMGRMLRMLEDLDDLAAARVVTWLASRFNSDPLRTLKA